MDCQKKIFLDMHKTIFGKQDQVSFHAITMNGDRSFQASKRIHKDHKNSPYDLGTILQVFSNQTITLCEEQAEIYSVIIHSGMLSICDQIIESLIQMNPRTRPVDSNESIEAD